jgi:hypothetical protein
MTNQLKRLYEPDGKNLATMVWGQAGSGKSFFIEQTVKDFLRANKSPDMRILYISPKNEGFESTKPVYDGNAVFKRLKKHRFVAWWPSMENLNEQVDDVINGVFDIKASNPKFKCCIIIDDAQVFLSSRKASSDAQKRLALTGRSKHIKAVYVAHNIVFARELEGQIDLLCGFSNPNPIYYKQSIERFNFDPAPFAEPIRELPYSFVWYDFRDAAPRLMRPIGDDGAKELTEAETSVPEPSDEKDGNALTE